MAKRKYQFKPDPKGSGFLNKLYIPPNRRIVIWKWVVFALFFLVCLVIQDSVTSRYRLFDGVLDLAPAAAVLVCMLQGSESGSVFLLTASAICVFAGTAPENYCILFLTTYGTLLSLFRERFLRRSLSSAWLCAGLAVALYEISVFLMGVFLGSTYWGRAPAFGMTILYSVLIQIPLYPIVRRIGKIGGETWKE